MKKFIVFLILVMLTASALCASAFDIQWGNRKTYQNHPSNTLRLWAESVESRSGTGVTFYVDSGVASGGDSTGSSWTNAVTTIDAAIAFCEAARGDIIKVAQGHQEVEAAAANLFDLNVAGVTIAGMSNGSRSGPVAAGAATLSLMPVFILDHASATITVSAPNCRLTGLRIESDVIDNAIGLTVAATANGMVIDHCIFSDGAVAEELVIGISLAALVTDVVIDSCTFSTVPSGGCASAIFTAGAATNITLTNLIIYGTYSAAALDLDDDAIVTLIIKDCMVGNIGTVALITDTGTTGILANCRLGGTTDVAGTLVGEAAMFQFGNLVAGDVGESAELDPAEGA